MSERNKRIKELADVVTDDEEALARRICEKHHVDPLRLFFMMASVQALGLGRNAQTSNLLRATADLIESSIISIEEIEQIVDMTGKKAQS